jgi:hypothetical protein
MLKSHGMNSIIPWLFYIDTKVQLKYNFSSSSTYLINASGAFCVLPLLMNNLVRGMIMGSLIIEFKLSSMEQDSVYA